MPKHVIAVTTSSKPSAALSAAKIKRVVEVPADVAKTWQRIYWVQGTGMPIGLGRLVDHRTTPTGG